MCVNCITILDKSKRRYTVDATTMQFYFFVSVSCENIKLALREMGAIALGLYFSPIFFLPSFISERHQLLRQMGEAATNLAPSISMQAHKKLSLSAAATVSSRASFVQDPALPFFDRLGQIQPSNNGGKCMY